MKYRTSSRKRKTKRRINMFLKQCRLGEFKDYDKKRWLYESSEHDKTCEKAGKPHVKGSRIKRKRSKK